MHLPLDGGGRRGLVDPLLHVVAPHPDGGGEVLGGGPPGDVEAPGLAALVLYVGVVGLLDGQVEGAVHSGERLVPLRLGVVAAVNVVEAELLLLVVGGVLEPELQLGLALVLQGDDEVVGPVALLQQRRGRLKGRRYIICEIVSKKMSLNLRWGSAAPNLPLQCPVRRSCSGSVSCRWRR